ncbi:hypothetical protein AVEN_63925-1 [Araneus ventricosus]|uniref:DUF5641 domain-containing protein n=1 Tax=Araneus ventricosus TaxID=182803 RepID=A0A4Y2HY22_ARAVE|nr:hypothetical protein AVEN_63925-1 [Araneus ventricosus]
MAFEFFLLMYIFIRCTAFHLLEKFQRLNFYTEKNLMQNWIKHEEGVKLLCISLANLLKALFDILKSTPVQEYVSSQFIRYHFIPPYSPHFGEIQEATVKQTKNQLLRACRATVLNFEELSTVLCQVEACLNSKPLVPLSSDPRDVRALTPGHFLIGSPLLEILDSNHEGDLRLTSRWHLIQSIRQNFWKQWTRDYFHHLQQRPKWTRLNPELQVGDLVAIHESTSPPLTWRLGHLKETYPGPNRLVRVVLIHTQDGDIKRPIVKVTGLISDS